MVQTQAKVMHIYQRLRSQIQQGQLKPGDSLPSQRELGLQFGVSENTASMALGRLAQTGLVTRRQKRGTVVNKLIAATGAIEFLRERSETAPDRSSSLSWVEQFTEISRQRGWTSHWHHMTLHEMADWPLMTERFGECRGLITFLVTPIHLDRLYLAGLPVVSVLPLPSGESRQPRCYPQISYDSVAAARMTMEHLIGLGHRRIAYVGSPRDPFRLVGFLEAAKQHQLTLKPQWIVQVAAESDVAESQEEQVGRHMVELMREDDRPEAFCFATYRQAMAAEKALLAMGISVPGDVALAVTNVNVGQPQAPVPLTCFGPSVENICAAAVQMIEENKPGAKPDPRQLIQPLFTPLVSLIRESCGARPKRAES